jgi:hypothetical protein
MSRELVTDAGADLRPLTAEQEVASLRQEWIHGWDETDRHSGPVSDVVVVGVRGVGGRQGEHGCPGWLR